MVQTDLPAPTARGLEMDVASRPLSAPATTASALHGDRLDGPPWAPTGAMELPGADRTPGITALDARLIGARRDSVCSCAGLGSPFSKRTWSVADYASHLQSTDGK